MITEALRHFPGIGPARLAQLQQQGVRQWADLVARADLLPPRLRDSCVAEAERCLDAWGRGDVAFFAERLHPHDKWRLLHGFLDRISFFDIETSGLECDAEITVIACWHRGALRTFVADENLDEFLELLDEVTLLASFNGNSFDVPRVLDAFHIPRLPCPHLDLRWPCYHLGYRGGLKEIAERAGIARPADLGDADGALAVRLWARWRAFGDRRALQELLRYCASDAALLRLLARRLSASLEDAEIQSVWEQLPQVEAGGGVLHGARANHRDVTREFGPGAPHRLRALPRR